MTNKSVFRNRILVSLLILSLCMSMAVPALAYQETTLYNGCRGEGVRAMQQALINLGYLHGNADGIFGIQTEEAVRAFQRSNGLTADGLGFRSGRDPGGCPGPDFAIQRYDPLQRMQRGRSPGPAAGTDRPRLFQRNSRRQIRG